MKTLDIAPGVRLGGDSPLVIIAGPCVIESRQHLLELAGRIADAARAAGAKLVFKSSFDKANRSSSASFRGPGLEQGLPMLAAVGEALGVPLLTDVHERGQVEAVAAVVDVIQIPAFLCRQTDLLCAAAATGKPINIKKGQFMAPGSMGALVDKARACGNERIMLTERGSSFGYHNLVVDMRSLPIMRALGHPVVFDATHSLQLPGALGESTGGQREFIPAMARAAVAAGIDALFLEVHDAPDGAPCDGPNMLAIEDLPALLSQVMALDALVREGRWTS